VSPDDEVNGATLCLPAGDVTCTTIIMAAVQEGITSQLEPVSEVYLDILGAGKVVGSQPLDVPNLASVQIINKIRLKTQLQRSAIGITRDKCSLRSC